MDSEAPHGLPRLGKFWIAEDPDARVSGVFSCGHEPCIEVNEPLTPALRRPNGEQISGVTTLVPVEEGPEYESRVIHGVLQGGESVTLVDAFTAGRSFNPFRPLATSQRLVGRYALLGGHVGAGEQFAHVRLRLEHLESWVALPGFSLSWTDDGAEIALSLRTPEDPVANLADGLAAFRSSRSRVWPVRLTSAGDWSARSGFALTGSLVPPMR